MNINNRRVHHAPQLVTEVYGFSVSSIKFTYVAGPHMYWEEDETCVFTSTWGTSFVVGSYDDHERVVNTVKFLVENSDEIVEHAEGELGEFVLQVQAIRRADDLIMELIED